METLHALVSHQYPHKFSGDKDNTTQTSVSEGIIAEEKDEGENYSNMQSMIKEASLSPKMLSKVKKDKSKENGSNSLTIRIQANRVAKSSIK